MAAKVGARGKEGRTVIARDETKGGGAPALLSLLFEDSLRPDVTAIRELAARSGDFTVDHEPSLARDGNWLELVVNGLAFDLRGLAPGNAEILGLHPNTFDLPSQFTPYRYSPLSLAPGPHLESGAAMMPVIRSQIWLAAQLCALPGVTAVGWLPARTLCSPEHFIRSMTTWLEGGAFPSFGLTALVTAPDGGMQSEGLAFFTGQELRIEPELAANGAIASRIALRLIHELAERGPVDKRERSVGPLGESLMLEPSSNRRFVRVSGA